MRLSEIKELSKRVIGHNKVRDLFILIEISNGNEQKKIAESYQLPESRITAIKQQNTALLNELTLEYGEYAQKAGRVRHALRMIQKKGFYSKKDALEWLKYLREELEGDGKGIAININNKIGANGTFSGEDRELQERIRREHFPELL